MMGHREEIKTGDEMDAFSSYTKRNIPKRGFRSAVKTKFNRRVRREVRVDLRHYRIDEFHSHNEFVNGG